MSGEYKRMVDDFFATKYPQALCAYLQSVYEQLEKNDFEVNEEEKKKFERALFEIITNDRLIMERIRQTTHYPMPDKWAKLYSASVPVLLDSFSEVVVWIRRYKGY
jgi:hypothetical protein